MASPSADSIVTLRAVAYVVPQLCEPGKGEKEGLRSSVLCVSTSGWIWTMTAAVSFHYTAQASWPRVGRVQFMLDGRTATLKAGDHGGVRRKGASGR